MKRSIKKIALISAAVLLIGILLCGIAMLSAPGGFRDVLNWLNVPVYLQKDENGVWKIEGERDRNLYDREYTAESTVRKLEAEGVDEDIVLIPSETRETVQVSYTEGDGVSYTVTESDGCLKIVRKGGGIQMGIDFTVHSSRTIRIEYPADGTLKDIRLTSVSGDMQIQTDKKAETLAVQTTSGNVCIQTAGKLGSLSVDTTSGSIDLQSVEAGTVTMNGVSMEVSGSLLCDTLAYSSTSGDAKLSLMADKADFTAVSTEFELFLSGSIDDYAVVCNGVSSDFSLNGETFEESHEQNTYIFLNGHAVKAREGEAEKAPHLLSFDLTSGDVKLKTGE